MRYLKLFSFILLLSIQACTTSSNLIDQEFDKVVLFNGVNEYEAYDIANKTINESEFRSILGVIKPIIREDPAAAKYPDYYFIDYSPKVIDTPSYLVMIKKDNGHIYYSGEYWPRKIKNLDWIFQRKEVKELISSLKSQ